MERNRSFRLQEFLDKKTDQYNRPSFIREDPICIPHLFGKKQDIEISGLFAAVFAWGNRATIINKTKELMRLMDDAPYEYCLHHSDNDLKKLVAFKHRTFNTTDLLYFIAFLKHHYSTHRSLETAFLMSKEEESGEFIESALTHFHNYFFSLEDAPARTRKHISTPYKNSACKRLNMYLRWMVRNDKRGVDFGIWKKIRPAQLICPIDLHVARVAKSFGLLERKQADWHAAVELTAYLRTLDAEDPVKYDYALFGLGVMEKFR
jgi:uncharacterized protein (TIGR02757 family)